MKYTFALLLALVFGFTAQAQHEETRKISSFNEVHLGGSYNVYMSEGNQEGIRFVGDPDKIALITVEVVDNVLKVSKKRGASRNNWNWGDGKAVKIYITYRNLVAIRNSGSNDVHVKDMVKADAFELTCSGSGNIEMSMDVEQLSLRISGSSDVELEGKATNQDIKVTGSGDIEALNLISKSISISITGSGDVTVHATERLEGRITGSGDIAYRGNPSTKMKITGSGDLERVN